jgi:hypothetical protein
MQLGVAWRNGNLIRNNMEYLENERYLRVSPTTKLKIIEIKGNIASILSKKAGKWVTTQPLDLTIQECDKQPRKVKTAACETVDYQLPHFAVCVKFRPLASLGTPWRHSKILRRCDTRRHGRSDDRQRWHRRVF